MFAGELDFERRRRSAPAPRRRRRVERAAERRARYERGGASVVNRAWRKRIRSRPAWIATIWPLVTGLAVGFLVGRETGNAARAAARRPSRRGRQGERGGPGRHQDAGQDLQVRERVPRGVDQVGRPRVGDRRQLRRAHDAAEDDRAAGAQRARLRVRLRDGEDRRLPEEGSELPAQPEPGPGWPSTWRSRARGWARSWRPSTTSRSRRAARRPAAARRPRAGRRRSSRSRTICAAAPRRPR